MNRDVVIHAPAAMARGQAILPGQSEADWLQAENAVLRVELTQQEISAETMARMLACLIRYTQAREGLGAEAVVEVPRDFVTMMGDVKVCVVERGGSFQLSLKEAR